jgi:1,2-diacylglycerol-3-alpha-glucose alpha-1,2-glucosyltransferase
MKIFQYFENQGLLSKSGIGHAQRLQQEALSYTDVLVTTNPLSTNYDLMHINTYGLWSDIQIRKARALNKKVIYHGHSTYEDFRNSFIFSNALAPLYKKHLVHLYSKADAIITPTEYSKKLISDYGIDLPIYALSNGIKLENYKKDQHKINKFKKFVNAKPNQKIIVSVGLYFERKGILDFVELASKNPDYLFVWFGHTSKWLIPNKIRKILNDHPNNLIFPGYITGDIIQGAYSGADLFLYPSYEETEGIVVLEALASSQNVLLRDIPVYEDWLVDGKNVYKAADLEEFNLKLNLILTKQVKDLSKQGYKVAKERNLPIIGKKLENIYREVLANE